MLVGITFMMLYVTACKGGEKDHEESDAVLQAVEIQTGNQTDSEKEAEEVREPETWISCEELSFAMKVPKSLIGQTSSEDPQVIWRGENDSMTIELCRWDQVSDPRDEALAALVSSDTGEKTEVVECGGRRLVKVLWPHGDVNYYLLGPEGDAYYLWITPYVMKDPDVYEKVRAVEESFCLGTNLSGEEAVFSVDLPKKEEIDYLVLVNKNTPLPQDWEEKLDLVTYVNSVGDLVPVERTAYKAYLALKKDLMENEGIDVDLDSAYRSVQYQQDILERFTEKYGAAYAARTVAKPGYSEHHTGLALDLYFRYDGIEVYENEDLIQYPEIWKKIHARLTDYGFILRYPGGKDGTVDYTYEPWHIRYVGEKAAKEIEATPGLSLEDYLESMH